MSKKRRLVDPMTLNPLGNQVCSHENGSNYNYRSREVLGIQSVTQ